MQLSLGISPCPNDTFIFDALINQKIDTQGITFNVQYHDVETLNQMAFKQQLQVTKLSFHAMAYVLANYQLLSAGSALGFGVGPLLVAKTPLTAQQVQANASQLTVAIPGKYTTANFLLGMAFPALTHKTETVFSSIEEGVLNGETDLGLIIHEGRFTYAQKGLYKVLDLGSWWEETTQLPIPLGGIVIDKSLPADVKQLVDKLIFRSIRHAAENPQSAAAFIKSHAQEMDDDVIFKHIGLYVNQHSSRLGPQGEAAVLKMFEIAVQNHLMPPVPEDIFVR